MLMFILTTAMVLTSAAIDVRRMSRARVVRSVVLKLVLADALLGGLTTNFQTPTTTTSWLLLAGGVTVAGVLGVTRGLLIRVWRAENGKIYRQGTPVTIGLFVALVLAKVATDGWAYAHHATASASVGQAFFLMALMTAISFAIVNRRAAKLRVVTAADPVVAAEPVGVEPVMAAQPAV